MTNRIPWGPDSPGYPQCPTPAGRDVTVWFRDGFIVRGKTSELWSENWKHHDDPADIIAYCDHDAQDEAAEADTMRYMREIAQNLGYPSVLEALEACPPNEAQADGQDQAMELPADVVRFLMGAGPLEGFYFGEDHPNRKGKFWWRTVIRERAGQPSEQDEARELLAEARRQLEYLDGRFPTGTTPAVLARIDAYLERKQ